MDLARELKVAGLPWRPRRGDLAMDRLNVAFIVVSDGNDAAGAVEIDTGRGVERRNYLGLTWIPRLDQLLAVLARHGPFEMSVRPAGGARKDSVWELTVAPRSGEDPGPYRASDGGDAAGKALQYLLAETGWSPGPAL